MATLAANVMHGLGHGPVGAAVAAWPAVALVGSYELLMTLIRNGPRVPAGEPDAMPVSGPVHAGDPLWIRAAEMFAEQTAIGAVPTIRAIRSALRVGQPRPSRYRRTWPATAVPDATPRSGGKSTRTAGSASERGPEAARQGLAPSGRARRIPFRR